MVGYCDPTNIERRLVFVWVGQSGLGGRSLADEFTTPPCHLAFNVVLQGTLLILLVGRRWPREGSGAQWQCSTRRGTTGIV
jgi:hypothetical protein